MSDAGSAYFNNKVGIGTTSPDEKLHISGGGIKVDGEATIASGAGTGVFLDYASNVGRITALDQGVAWRSLRLNAADIQFYIAGGEKMRIDGTGVGIGTSSPSEPLHVNEGTGGVSTTLLLQNSSASVDGRGTNLTFKSSSTEIGQIQSKTVSDATSGILAFKTASSGTLSEQMRIDKDGKVGIGTASPTGKLEIAATGTNAAPHIKLVEDSDTREFNIFNDGSGNGHLVLADSDDDTPDTEIVLNDNGIITMLTGNTERMRIDSSGNIGIGTSSPADRLHVALDSSTTNAEVEVMRIEASSSGTPAVGFGPFIDFRGDRISGGVDSYGRLGFEADAMPSTKVDGAFVIQPAEDGTYTERFRVSSDGKVGIGTSSPAEMLHVTGDIRVDTDLILQPTKILYLDGGNDTYINEVAANEVGINTAGAERLRIDSSGRLVVGATAAVTTTGGTGAAQVLGTGNSDTILTLGRFSANNGTASINFVKSRNGTIGSNTIVQDGDTLGSIVFAAADGSDFVSHAAKIDARVDGTPGADDTPGRLAFYTTTDGGDSAAERMRITNSGDVGIGTSAPDTAFHVAKTNASASYSLASRYVAQFERNGACDVSILASNVQSSSLSFSDPEDADVGRLQYLHSDNSLRVTVNASEAMRIDSGQNVMVNRTSQIGTNRFSVNFASGSSEKGVGINSSDAGATTHMTFLVEANAKGSITTDGSNTTYNTSSDARLKDVTGEARGLEVINELNPVSYSWKETGISDEGLIAQEVEKLVPNAVVQDDNEYYQMDYSKLVTHLVKGMQEQQEQIDSLKSEIAILKEK